MSFVQMFPVYVNFALHGLGLVLLLYRVGDCVMPLCPVCNRRTRNFSDDDDDDDGVNSQRSHLLGYNVRPILKNTELSMSALSVGVTMT